MISVAGCCQSDSTESSPRCHSERGYDDTVDLQHRVDPKVSHHVPPLKEEDSWTVLSVSPRSRLGSETFFDELEVIMQSSNLPPVGTTKPPLYPKQGECRSKRIFKRLVNKPIKHALKSLS